MTAERFRRLLLGVALAAVAIGAFQPFYLRVWKQDWPALEAYLTELPYRKLPGLRRLCLEADRRTPPGSRVLFLMPPQTTKDAYDYGFGRTQYLLAAKDVVPRFDRSGRGVEYILCWRCTPPSGFVTVWEGGEGSLARRRP